MNLKKWKLGLIVAVIIGFFTACTAAAMLDGLVINWKFFLFFLGLIGKDVILYLKEHPVETITDTAFLDDRDMHPEKPKPNGFSAIEVLIVVGIVALVLFVLSGCSSAGANTFKAQKVTHTTVEIGMSVWNDYVGKYHPGVRIEQQVKDAFLKYQAAQLLVSDALETYYAATDETSTQKLEAASASAAEALASLNALLKQFKIQVYATSPN